MAGGGLALRLTLMPGRLGVARLPADDTLPGWLDWSAGPLVSVSKTADELSIVCAEAQIPPSVTAERGFRAFVVSGPLDFALTGILARLSGALAEAKISLFAVSTFDTDWILVREDDLPAAWQALAAVADLA